MARSKKPVPQSDDEYSESDRDEMAAQSGTEQVRGHGPDTDARAAKAGRSSAQHAAVMERHRRTHGPNAFGIVQHPSQDEFYADNPAGRDDVQDANDDDEIGAAMAANPQSPAYAAPGIGIGAQWAAAGAQVNGQWRGMDGFKGDSSMVMNDKAASVRDALMSGRYQGPPTTSADSALSIGHATEQHAEAVHLEQKPTGMNAGMSGPPMTLTAPQLTGRSPAPVTVTLVDLRPSAMPTMRTITDAHTAARAAGAALNNTPVTPQAG